MKVLSSILIVLVIAATAVAQTGVHKYVGVDKCKICHKLALYGDQYDIWAKSLHAQAYITLAGEAAKKIGQALKIDDPQKSAQCLSCHVTAFGIADSLKATGFSQTEGVGCETCHGPGSDYQKMSVMKDRAKAVAAGLLIPNEQTCLKCHNDKSPTFKTFNYTEMLKKIAHPLPKKESQG